VQGLIFPQNVRNVYYIVLVGLADFISPLTSLESKLPNKTTIIEIGPGVWKKIE